MSRISKFAAVAVLAVAGVALLGGSASAADHKGVGPNYIVAGGSSGYCPVGHYPGGCYPPRPYPPVGCYPRQYPPVSTWPYPRPYPFPFPSPVPYPRPWMPF